MCVVGGRSWVVVGKECVVCVVGGGLWVVGCGWWWV